MVDSGIDEQMERASEALARMNYLACERLCLESLALARGEGRFEDYARILLPLQESRRQRRLTAAEGGIRLGTAGLEGEPVDWLPRLNPGCILLTRPHGPAQARDLLNLAHERGLHIEVLLADNATADEKWQLRAFAGPDVRCDVDAPPRTWRDRWLHAREVQAGQGEIELEPSGYFLAASEALGDEALRMAESEENILARLARLEACLEVITDHELLHQALARTAREAARQPEASPPNRGESATSGPDAPTRAPTERPGPGVTS